MTRQEQIEKAATAKSRGETPYYYDAFVEGAKWADEHPHWISVEDELPPRFKLYPNDSVYVLTYGLRTITAFYNYDKWEWVGNTQVTHWMPLPQPPIISKMENTEKKGGAQ